MPLYVEGVAAFDGDVDEAVTHWLRWFEHVADTFPEATFFLGNLRHADDGVLRYRGDNDFVFKLGWDVVVDDAVEFGEGVEVVELLRQLVAELSLLISETICLLSSLNSIAISESV